MSLFSLDSLEDLGRPGATVEKCRSHAGAHVKFDNGWVVSVQWGLYTYSDNHDGPASGFDRPAPDSTTAEIAVWKTGSPMEAWPGGDTVQGWQSWERVQELLDLAAADDLRSVLAEKVAQDPEQEKVTPEVSSVGGREGEG